MHGIKSKSDKFKLSNDYKREVRKVILRNITENENLVVVDVIDYDQSQANKNKQQIEHFWG